MAPAEIGRHRLAAAGAFALVSRQTLEREACATEMENAPGMLPKKREECQIFLKKKIVRSFSLISGKVRAIEERLNNDCRKIAEQPILNIRILGLNPLE